MQIHFTGLDIIQAIVELGGTAGYCLSDRLAVLQQKLGLQPRVLERQAIQALLGMVMVGPMNFLF